MPDALTTDEYDALAQILRGPKGGRPSACVARNAKRLAGLKYIAHEKNGSLGLTDKGRETLFIKQCIDALRALATDSGARPAADVANFLLKKGHLVANAATGTLELTQRGRESLADIDTGRA